MRTKRISLTISGSRGVWVWSRRLGRFIDLGRPDNKKLNVEHVNWILREKRKGILTNAQMARCMGVSPRWAQKLGSRYGRRSKPLGSYPPRMGRPPEDGAYGGREYSAVLRAGQAEPLGSVGLQRTIRAQTGINTPNNVIHSMLLDEDMAERHPKKDRRRKWVRYEREHSNSLWHTGWKQLDDGRWLPCYEDDASRFVTGYGVFGNPTAENALAVLDAAIRNHGQAPSAPDVFCIVRCQQAWCPAVIFSFGLAWLDQRVICITPGNSGELCNRLDSRAS